MLISVALMLLVGYSIGRMFQAIKLPSLVGMMLAGLLLGPSFFNVLDQSILDISSSLRQIALIVILTRAGLSLDIQQLKKAGKASILMCFVPACFEIVGVVLLAPLLLKVTYLEAALMGSVLAAVSPAIIIPRMLKIKEEGYGTKKSIPQIILTGASVDDVFVIVLFASFSSLLTTGKVEVMEFINIPISILLGILVGYLLGYLLTSMFKKMHTNSTLNLLVVLSTSFLLVGLETSLKPFIGFSGLLAIMAMSAAMYKQSKSVAKTLSNQYQQLWFFAEIILFVLVGSMIDINYLLLIGASSLLVLLGCTLFRMLGVWFSTRTMKLDKKESLFMMVAYTPKATVQAALGGVPLALGLACGQQVLSIAVLSIIVSAPLGAFAIDQTYKKWLTK